MKAKRIKLNLFIWPEVHNPLHHGAVFVRYTKKVPNVAMFDTPKVQDEVIKTSGVDNATEFDINTSMLMCLRLSNPIHLHFGSRRGGESVCAFKWNPFTKSNKSNATKKNHSNNLDNTAGHYMERQ